LLSVRTYVEPTVVLVSTKIDDAVINHFKSEARDGDPEASNDRFRLPFLLEVRPASEFHYDAAKRKLGNLGIGEPNGPQVTFLKPGDIVAEGNDERNKMDQQARILRLGGWIDVESRLTVS
jgi:DNA mismatch repair protein MSH5